MRRTLRADSAVPSRIVGRDWYKKYYVTKGADRNSLLLNRGVLFQNLARDVALVNALRSTRLNPQEARVLDVGCGDGASLITFLGLGFVPANLYGIDFQEERVHRAKERCSGMNVQAGDATKMDYPAESFDIVFESTMFIHSVDEQLSLEIAREMLRVAKPGGNIVLCDWRYTKPGSAAHKALTQKRIAKLFCVGQRTIRQGVFRGPLVPPVGRFLSSHLPSAYFLVRAFFPFLTGQMTTVLRKS